MRKFRAVALTAAMAAALVVSPTAASAAAGSKVKGVGNVELFSTTYSFNFSGSRSTGGFTVLNPQTRAVIAGKASCYQQLDAHTAVIVGDPNKDTDPHFGTLQYLRIVAYDSGSSAPDRISITRTDSSSCNIAPPNPLSLTAINNDGGYITLTL